MKPFSLSPLLFLCAILVLPASETPSREPGWFVLTSTQPALDAVQFPQEVLGDLSTFKTDELAGNEQRRKLLAAAARDDRILLNIRMKILRLLYSCLGQGVANKAAPEGLEYDGIQFNLLYAVDYAQAMHQLVESIIRYDLPRDPKQCSEALTKIGWSCQSDDVEYALEKLVPLVKIVP